MAIDEKEFNPTIGVNRGLSYINWIDKQPLYIHNHKLYYENTMKALNSKENTMMKEVKIAGLKYIKLLEDREKNLFGLNDGQKTQEALNIIAKEAFVNNENINKINEILEVLWGKKKNIKISVTKKNGHYYFNFSKGKKKYDPIELFKMENKKNDETNIESNVYDYSKSKIEDKELEKDLQNLVQDMQKGLNDYFKMTNVFAKILNAEELNQTIYAPDFINYCQKLRNLNDQSPSEDLLAFFIDGLGEFISIRGRFLESNKVNFSKNINKIFEESFKTPIKMERRDYSKRYEATNRLNKVDNVIIGGPIQEATPLTVSRKVTSTRGAIKVHDTSYQAILDSLKKESPIAYIIYYYFSVNNAFWSNEESINVLKTINRYMSYLFLSGKNNDSPENQAMFLVITGKQTIKGGGGYKTFFVPFSFLLRGIMGITQDEEYKKIIQGLKTKEISVNLDMSDLQRPKGSWDLFNDLWIYKLGAAGANGVKFKYEYLAFDSNVRKQMDIIQEKVIGMNKSRRVTMNYPQIEKIANYYMQKTGIIT